MVIWHHFCLFPQKIKVQISNALFPQVKKSGSEGFWLLDVGSFIMSVIRAGEAQ